MQNTEKPLSYLIGKSLPRENETECYTRSITVVCVAKRACNDHNVGRVPSCVY